MMKHTLKFILIGLLCCLCNFTVQAQTRNRQYEEYIHKYKDLAVDEMKRYRIPASITLAQGLLESGAGKSMLARKSNNHFGINVVVTGLVVLYGMMMMPVMNVFVPISTLVSHMKIILKFLKWTFTLCISF